MAFCFEVILPLFNINVNSRTIFHCSTNFITNLFRFYLFVSCLCNKQKNTWVLGNTGFISRVQHDISLVRCAHW